MLGPIVYVVYGISDRCRIDLESLYFYCVFLQMPGRLPPGYAPQMYGHHAPPGMMPPGQYAPPGYGAPPPPHHMVRPHQMGDMVKMPNGPTPAEWAAAQSRKACITSFFVLH